MPAPFTTPEADRFRCKMEVPDPPASPQGRQRYWADTVQEAVAELRRRLASSNEAVVTLALLTIVKLETTRMRHGRPLSGSLVPNVSEADDGYDPLPELRPLDAPFVPMPIHREEKAPAVPPAAVADQPTTEVPPTTVRPARERAPTAAPATAPPPPAPIYTEPKRMFSDRDDDWTRDPDRPVLPADWEPGPTRAEEDARYDAVVERQREGFIESSGLYPEDEWPNNPDYFRFKAEPRPHPAELRWREWRFGITTRPAAGGG